MTDISPVATGRSDRIDWPDWHIAATRDCTLLVSTPTVTVLPESVTTSPDPGASSLERFTEPQARETPASK
jgi:hypothetical protein